MNIQTATKDDLFKVIEDEEKVRIDSFVESAVELAEEVQCSECKMPTPKL